MMKYTVKTILLLATLLLAVSAQAQNPKLYKKIVKDLSSARFEGRGYVNDGVRKAEAYLVEQYRMAGADQVVLQPFTIDINTFPGKTEMSVDGKKLEPGSQFVMREYSPGVKGTFPLYYIDTLNYDFAKIKADLAKPENKGCLVVSDFWFTYKHSKDFKKILSKDSLSSAGVIYTWDTPLKFYKAYGHYVVDKPIVWCGPDFPKDASTVTLDVENEFRPAYECRNVIAKVEGARHDSTIVFVAHYDHLGHFGKKLYFPGADDNASGNAALVTLAEYYSKHKPAFDILFVSVSGEEANLRGSTYFVEHPLVPLESIKYLINLDMIGDDNPEQYCEVSDAGRAGLALFQSINAERQYFTKLKCGKLAANSDHYPFAMKGVPCIFLENEEGSVFPYYHTAQDDMSRFVGGTYEKIFKMVVEFIEKY